MLGGGGMPIHSVKLKNDIKLKYKISYISFNSASRMKSAVLLAGMQLAYITFVSRPGEGFNETN